VVDVKQVILDKKATIDNQMIMGIEKTLVDLQYSDDQMAELYRSTLSLCATLN
jgi:hypothetical protein